ncbi:MULTISPECIES: hypothetical protein [Myxococcus]|uniref:hypothetical protein n=1 Tax=Myxococcus TaxID=32 RepID=UPI00148C9E4B|nr:MULTISPECIES: hypothetical protein [Myxococcus]QPM83010.1 hypothetical protein I5Q59_17840 [Myxococcus xanthus]QVW65316.1 hypothetical protein JTM82_23185 [Myxococcus xanthus DZ2]UEO01617.1 hypothetical protein K1515_19605 [Myxococcus xanthus DZ2]UYI18201.1 hypothetical protein N3T43_18395 [Myxococcus xanthus]UYI25654.1 hypothetical protein N1129_18850 [Myxococcus xanthus]
MKTVIIRPGAAGPLDAWEAVARRIVDVFLQHIVPRSYIDYGAFSPQATARLHDVLERNVANVVVAFTHGHDDRLLCPSSQTAIGTDDAHLIKGKFCYFIACCTAVALGPTLIGAGASGFVGFKIKYKFATHPSMFDRQTNALLEGILAHLNGGADAATCAKLLSKSLLAASHALARDPKTPLPEKAFAVWEMVKMANGVVHYP